MRIMNANLKRSLRVVVGSHLRKRSMDKEMEVEVSKRVTAERIAATRAAGLPVGTHWGTDRGGPGMCSRCDIPHRDVSTTTIGGYWSLVELLEEKVRIKDPFSLLGRGAPSPTLFRRTCAPATELGSRITLRPKSTMNGNDECDMSKDSNSDKDPFYSAQRCSMPDQIKELLPRLLSITEDAQHAARDRGAADFLDSSHHHAHMLALYDDGYASRSNCFVQCQSHLLGKALLHLQTTCECLCDAGQLGQADDQTIGNVTDMNLALEWDHVVFTQGGDLNIAHNDHLIVLFVKDGVGDDVCRGRIRSL